MSTRILRSQTLHYQKFANLKDNRLLPSGFDKHSATQDIAVVGDALDDPDFTNQGSTIRYVIDTAAGSGPFHVRAELWYQPVGFRWAHNLEPYQAAEPQRFVRYYESESRRSAVVLPAQTRTSSRVCHQHRRASRASLTSIPRAGGNP